MVSMNKYLLPERESTFLIFFDKSARITFLCQRLREDLSKELVFEAFIFSHNY